MYSRTKLHKSYHQKTINLHCKINCAVLRRVLGCFSVNKTTHRLISSQKEMLVKIIIIIINIINCQRFEFTNQHSVIHQISFQWNVEQWLGNVEKSHALFRPACFNYRCVPSKQINHKCNLWFLFKGPVTHTITHVERTKNEQSSSVRCNSLGVR